MTQEVRVSVADPNRRRFTANTCCEQGCKGSNSSDCSQAIVPSKAPPTGRFLNQIPESILQDAALNEAIAILPPNYNFEIHKCVWHIRKNGYKKVALQLPEGFHRYALVLYDVLVRFGGCEDAVILADVAYGACCIDDVSAASLGCDFIIHYGHSCLIPITVTRIPVLYVFVEIKLTHSPLVGVLEANFGGKRLALMATVQYASILHAVKEELRGKMDLFIPQIKPLSPGEVLGCTSPRLPPDTDALIFIADGRFHLESAMIANPTVPAYRYDPFTKRVFHEQYDHSLMLSTRRRMVDAARDARHFGIILGTLGRQGSPAVLQDIAEKLQRAGRTSTVFLMAEVRPEKLAKLKHIDAWVQTSCPRLSIDWNYTFGEDVPLLTPYELNVMLSEVEAFEGPGTYPMDYYATGDAAHKTGPWTPGYHLRPPRQTGGGRGKL